MLECKRSKERRERELTTADLEQVVVANDHGLPEPVDDDGVLLDDVVRAKDDGPTDGEDGAPRVENRPCARGAVNRAYRERVRG